MLDAFEFLRSCLLRVRERQRGGYPLSSSNELGLKQDDDSSAVHARDFLSLCRSLREEKRGVAYIFASLPAAITGPVGWPVGDPPGGSSETASVASSVTRPTRSEGMSSLIG
jgi:hypothetical protein